MSLSYSNHGLLTSMFPLWFFQWGLTGLICNYSVRLLMLLFENDNKIKQLKLHILRVRGKCRWERKNTHYLMAFILKPICRVCACLKYTVSMNRKGASFCLQWSVKQFTILLKLLYFSKLYILILLHRRILFILIVSNYVDYFFLACWIQKIFWLNF